MVKLYHVEMLEVGCTHQYATDSQRKCFVIQGRSVSDVVSYSETHFSGYRVVSVQEDSNYFINRPIADE